MSQPVSSRKASTAHSIVTAMIILVIVGGVLQIVVGLRAVSGRGELQVAAALRPDELESFDLPDGIEAHGSFPVALEIEDPTLGQVALAAAIQLGPWLLALAALLILRQLAGSIRDGNPFGAVNVGRLRKLGAVLLVIPVVKVLNSFLLGGILAMSRVPEAVATSTELDLAPAVVALGVFVLAEVFQEGVRLREDAEGTV